MKKENKKEMDTKGITTKKIQYVCSECERLFESYQELIDFNQAHHRVLILCLPCLWKFKQEGGDSRDEYMDYFQFSDPV
jgi:hypothetical protein